MWQRLIKLVNKRNSTTRKRFNVSKNMSIHFTQVNFTPIERICGWAFKPVVKGISERSGLIREWGYLQ